ncbi:hypothetical protein BC940DRAFT_338406 [Gongronella butleri]|nr:hypothetical protein BC940DRAFT_338406 [Gongronella butleri]
MFLDVPRLITAILPLVGSLQVLNLDFWSDPCKLSDIAALHRVVPSLTALSLTMNHGSWVFPRLFLESKHHRADHDPDCDACTNPWLSVTSLSIIFDIVAISLDPTIAHWPSLMSLALTHACAGVILDAVYQFTSVSGVSMSPLASLTVETVKDFASTYTMGLLTAFPSLYKLKIVNDWDDLIDNATAPPLPLASLPPPSFGHPLYDLHVMSVNMAILLRISELCPQLNSVILVFNRRWGMRGEVSLLAWRDGEIPPDEYMPSHWDQLPIVQKF